MSTGAESRRTRLTPRQWAEAAALWQSGEVTLEDLENRYGASKETFSRKFSAMGVKKGENAAQHAERVREEITRGAIQDAALIAQRVRRTKEDHYEWSTALGRLIMHEIAKAQREKIPLAAIDPTIKTIKRALEGLQIARAERYAVLGLDKDDYVDDEQLPELMIAEMTASEIEQIRQRQRQMDDGLGIELSGEGDDELEEGVVVEGEGE